MNTANGSALLTRTAATEAVVGAGWRFLLGTLCSSVAVDGLDHASRVASAAITASGGDADGHLRVDLRPDRVELSLQTREVAGVTVADTDLARRITAALAGLGGTDPRLGERRPVQMLEIAIDAVEISAVRPFWKAVLGYTAEPGDEGSTGAIVDEAGQLPAVWFQQMDAPRPQRNRIHLDQTVPHDEAEARVAAALNAGGVLVDGSHARAFWVLADAEGNEVCVCTWQDRD
ncbi:MAG: VOC family protein [Nocardioidaceae bacterium]